jgi:hypothetical protein
VDELNDLGLRPVAVIGHSGEWPPTREKNSLESTIGRVSQILEFVPVWDAEHRWTMLDYSARTDPGSSGAPVILSNGHVVAVHAWRRPVNRSEVAEGGWEYSASGITVYALHELINHHNLAPLLQH